MGLEPTTSAVTGRRANQLRYRASIHLSPARAGSTTIACFRGKAKPLVRPAGRPDGGRCDGAAPVGTAPSGVSPTEFESVLPP